jgi:hypothetical protein
VLDPIIEEVPIVPSDESFVRKRSSHRVASAASSSHSCVGVSCCPPASLSRGYSSSSSGSSSAKLGAVPGQELGSGSKQLSILSFALASAATVERDSAASSSSASVSSSLARPYQVHTPVQASLPLPPDPTLPSHGRSRRYGNPNVAKAKPSPAPVRLPRPNGRKTVAVGTQSITSYFSKAKSASADEDDV